MFYETCTKDAILYTRTRKFMLQLLRRYNLKHNKKRTFTFDEKIKEQRWGAKQHSFVYVAHYSPTDCTTFTYEVFAIF